MSVISSILIKMTDLNQQLIDDHDQPGGCSQRNGQRIYRSEGWKGGPPGRGCEVYVTRIPRDCFEKVGLREMSLLT